MKRKAFTLAEIMIVLTVIGILSVILLPVAFNSTPDKNILKFKKAHNTLASAVRELVSSDKYYLNGDLGMKADGTWVDFDEEEFIASADSTNIEYFCKSFSDVINFKFENCFYNKANDGHFAVSGSSYLNNTCAFGLVPESYGVASEKTRADWLCIQYVPGNYMPHVVLPDGVYFYDGMPACPFGRMGPQEYKLFCVDVDGPQGAIKPFAFGIRPDGKIFTGCRADWWLSKEIVQKEDSGTCPCLHGATSLCD